MRCSWATTRASSRVSGILARARGCLGAHPLSQLPPQPVRPKSKGLTAGNLHAGVQVRDWLYSRHVGGTELTKLPSCTSACLALPPI